MASLAARSWPQEETGTHGVGAALSPSTLPPVPCPTPFPKTQPPSRFHSTPPHVGRSDHALGLGPRLPSMEPVTRKAWTDGWTDRYMVDDGWLSGRTGGWNSG